MTIAGSSSDKLEEKLKERQEIPLEDKWNVEALYASWDEWEKDVEKWGRPKNKPHWPEFDKFKGKLRDVSQLASLLAQVFLFDRHLSKLYTYAHLRHDEDVSSDIPKKAHARLTGLLYEFREETSWMEPEILLMSESELAHLLKAKELKEYQLHLERIIRQKPHTLSSEMEKLLALSGKALETSQRAFGVFNNADLKFAPVEDSKGQMRELSHGKYSLYMREKDRKLRKETYSSLHKSFSNYENTLCELIQGQMQKHAFDAKARNYQSCLQAALFPNQIEESVYTSLIEAVNKNLPILHRYMKLRKKVLGYDELHLYDMYVPMMSEVDISMSYQEAEKLVIESVLPLGKEYQAILAKGLMEERWVDRYENMRKRSGAYSSGCYDSSPYILMNYHGSFRDVTTLTHEAGHSMHTYMSSKNQPYQYSQYPIFLAEVASTFHEELLFQHLMKTVKTKEEKAYLLDQKIDDMRATFFRQTMFAEFELKMHQWVEQDVPLTPSLLKQEYRSLNQKYFGPDVVVDEESDIEWARIPHFYYNFYVYQYATGLSAACALQEKLMKEGEPARLKYLQFISSGSSGYPLDLLANAGVDMRKPAAVSALLHRFDELTRQLEELMQ